MTYSKEKASFNKDEIMNPEYKEESLTKDVFLWDGHYYEMKKEKS